MKNTRIHAWISGKVQGVFYRESTEYWAKNLDLKGWIRNTDDGRVELIVEGPEDRIKKFMKWCEKGPVAAKVVNINKREELYTGEFEDFKAIY